MIFDGMRFTRSNKVVTLPQAMWYGELKNYVAFGRICNKDATGAVKTNWTRNGEIIYALPVPCDRHSLTNMMYGTDGYTYLILNGKVYVKKS